MWAGRGSRAQARETAAELRVHRWDLHAELNVSARARSIRSRQVKSLARSDQLRYRGLFILVAWVWLVDNRSPRAKGFPTL